MGSSIKTSVIAEFQEAIEIELKDFATVNNAEITRLIEEDKQKFFTPYYVVLAQNPADITKYFFIKLTAQEIDQLQLVDDPIVIPYTFLDKLLIQNPELEKNINIYDHRTAIAEGFLIPTGDAAWLSISEQLEPFINSFDQNFAISIGCIPLTIAALYFTYELVHSLLTCKDKDQRNKKIKAASIDAFCVFIKTLGPMLGWSIGYYIIRSTIGIATLGDGGLAFSAFVIVTGLLEFTLTFISSCAADYTKAKSDGKSNTEALASINWSKNLGGALLAGALSMWYTVCAFVFVPFLNVKYEDLKNVFCCLAVGALIIAGSFLSTAAYCKWVKPNIPQKIASAPVKPAAVAASTSSAAKTTRQWRMFKPGSATLSLATSVKTTPQPSCTLSPLPQSARCGCW